jgi:hypothetical protein
MPVPHVGSFLRIYLLYDRQHETRAYRSASKDIETPQGLQGAHHAQAFLRCLTFRGFTFLTFSPTCRRTGRRGTIRTGPRRRARTSARCPGGAIRGAFLNGWSSDGSAFRIRLWHTQRRLSQQNFQPTDFVEPR